MALLYARMLPNTDYKIVICKACMRDRRNPTDSISIFPPVLKRNNSALC